MKSLNESEQLNSLYVRELRLISEPKWPNKNHIQVKFNDSTPIPPVEHRRRIYGSVADIDANANHFLNGGFQISTRIMNIYEAYSAKKMSRLRILDWGVGCGRLSRHFINSDSLDVQGVDVDPININWLHDNYPSQKNHLVDTNPLNLVLNEDKFDLIYSYSVMSHLHPRVGLPWLAAISNYCSDLMLISTHGFRNTFEYSWSEVSANMALFLNRGYVGDESQNHDIADVTPEKYYGDYGFSYSHIINEWSKVVDIVDIIPMGIGHHDLIICRPHEVRP